MVEEYLEEKTSEGRIKATCLRYFNAAGASYSKRIGECHEPETHLIPNIIRSSINKDLNFDIFGNNYNTPDGTCIRDYIHVLDLAEAHFLALKEMNQKSNFQIYNLGSGSGFSVMEIKNTCEEVLNINIPYKVRPRREGDPAILVSDINKASKVLGWKPDNSEIKNIIETAYNFEKVKDSLIRD
jgi:UDP-glucose 4-epimerase